MKFEKMQEQLIAMLEVNGIEYTTEGTPTQADFYIKFEDNLFNKGEIAILVTEGEDEFHLFTEKEKDDGEIKNERYVKSVKAVNSYIKKFI